MAKKPAKPLKAPAKAPEKIKVFIATPMYGGMCSGVYTQSIIMMQAAFQTAGVEACISFMFNESLITRARNALAHAFMQSDCTHLLFVDADIKWNGYDVLRMFDAEKDIICGVYPKKEVNWHTVSNAVKKEVPIEQLKNHTGSWVVNLIDYKPDITVPNDKPLEVWAAGTGMMLIKRKVFEKLKKKVPSYNNDVLDQAGTIGMQERISEYFTTSIEPGTERLLSEDYHFCKIAREAGFTVWAAPWANLVHCGTYNFSGQLPKV
jgi:hypothetical protein